MTNHKLGVKGYNVHQSGEWLVFTRAEKGGES